MLDLMKVLTEEDHELIKQYMTYYSEAGYHYVGNEVFLREWAKNKKKLFGLLGGKLSREIDFEYNKDAASIRNEINELLEKHPFGESLRDILSCKKRNRLKDELIENSNINITIPTYGNFSYSLCEVSKEMALSCKFKFKNAKKMFQMNEKESPIKALGKFTKYIYENVEFIRHEYPGLLCDYESFRQKHSLILNEKTIKGKLVFSIHPLDFLTMSNNSSGWDSCMKWGQIKFDCEPGCYHVGTIEMMNSNNVVCCFIKSKKPYVFYENEEKGLRYEWNNKKWRSLAIVTKDIIASGKSYPYKNKETTFAMLEELNKRANENKGWHYKYGIEPYRDMIRIKSNSNMENHRRYINRNQTYGHKRIIFDTKGMYNDYLNDHQTEFYCYRNAVDHTKVISYSGKALCSCCGQEFLKEYDYCGNDYNDRYDNTGRDICEDCSSEIGQCLNCNKMDNDKDTPFLVYKNKTRICFNCFKESYHYCPDCGELYMQRGSFIEDGSKALFFRKILPVEDAINSIHRNRIISTNNSIKEQINDIIKKKKPIYSWNCSDYFYRYNACQNCIDKAIKSKKYGQNLKRINIRYTKDCLCYYCPNEFSEEDKQKYSEENFHKKVPTLEDFMNYKEKMGIGE